MSDALSIVHQWPGFAVGDGPLAFTSTRNGGVSRGAYESLNVGRSVGDDDAHVTENRARLLASHGIDVSSLALCHQTHSDHVAIVSEGGGALSRDTAAPAVDALATRTPGLAVGVMVADCAPVLLWAPGAGVVAAVHAGRVGMYDGILRNTLTRMRGKLGVAVADCLAIVGPSIGPCCYEVSSEIADSFRRRFGAEAAAGRQLDLWTTARRILVNAGLEPDSVGVTANCSSCGPEALFSHRRDGGTTGRMLSVVVAPDGGG